MNHVLANPNSLHEIKGVLTKFMRMLFPLEFRIDSLSEPRRAASVSLPVPFGRHDLFARTDRQPGRGRARRRLLFSRGGAPRRPPRVRHLRFQTRGHGGLRGARRDRSRGTRELRVLLRRPDPCRCAAQALRGGADRSRTLPAIRRPGAANREHESRSGRAGRQHHSKRASGPRGPRTGRRRSRRRRPSRCACAGRSSRRVLRAASQPGRGRSRQRAPDDRALSMAWRADRGCARRRPATTRWCAKPRGCATIWR